MYEYWFLGDESQTGETTDWLELLCLIAAQFGPVLAGQFVEALLIEKTNDLECLRVIDWKFDFAVNDKQTIRIHKTS